MIIRCLAYSIIIMGCGYIGLYMSSSIDKRIEQLNDFEYMLKQLSFNISFLSLPMQEAIYKVSETQKGVIRKITENVSGLMLGRPDITMQFAWNHAISNYKNSLYLKESEISILEDFSTYIGNGDKDETLACIRAASAKLHLAADSARDERMKDGKLYKSIGFLSGMLIVILLF